MLFVTKSMNMFIQICLDKACGLFLENSTLCNQFSSFHRVGKDNNAYHANAASVKIK